MKKYVAALAAVSVLIAASVAIADSTGITTSGVDVTKTGFSPKAVTVEAGNAVSWKNTDTVQHAVAVDKTQCKLALDTQQSSSCTFATAGTFSYSDPTTKDKNFSGTVTVTPAVQRSVTLAVNRNIAIFGDSVTVYGTISDKVAGKTVTVSVKPANEPVARIDVTTTTGGAWSLRVQPRIDTQYTAQYAAAQSPALTVGVRPRITFQKVGMNKYLIVVLAEKSLAGSSVQLNRFVPGSGWQPLDVAQLTGIARTDSIAVKTVTANVSRGTKLRAEMTDAQTGPNYIDAHSNFVVN